MSPPVRRGRHRSGRGIPTYRCKGALPATTGHTRAKDRSLRKAGARIRLGRHRAAMARNATAFQPTSCVRSSEPRLCRGGALLVLRKLMRRPGFRASLAGAAGVCSGSPACWRVGSAASFTGSWRDPGTDADSTTLRLVMLLSPGNTPLCLTSLPSPLYVSLRPHSASGSSHMVVAMPGPMRMVPFDSYHRPLGS